MNYALAIHEFRALYGEIDKIKRDDFILLTQEVASSYIQKLDILLKNFYPPIDDSGSTQFTSSLDGIAINSYSSDHVSSDKTKLNRLQGLIENILVDLRLKETIANDKFKDNKIKSELQLATAQNREFRAILAEKVEELNALVKKFDELKNTNQKKIDALKNKYQSQLDYYKNIDAAGINLFNLKKPTQGYKLPFYTVLFLMLSLLTFGVPYMLKSMNWKYIIGIELAIIASILIFYFKNIPAWVQFLVATVLAILAIFFT